MFNTGPKSRFWGLVLVRLFTHEIRDAEKSEDDPRAVRRFILVIYTVSPFPEPNADRRAIVATRSMLRLERSSNRKHTAKTILPVRRRFADATESARGLGAFFSPLPARPPGTIMPQENVRWKIGDGNIGFPVRNPRTVCDSIRATHHRSCTDQSPRRPLPRHPPPPRLVVRPRGRLCYRITQV